MKSEKDKKQMVVVGALVLVIVAVGGFQLLSGGPPPAAPPADKSGERAKQEAAAKAVADAIKNPSVATALKVRDPFKPAEFSAPKATEPEKPKDPPAPAPRPRNRNFPDVPPLPPGEITDGKGNSTTPPIHLEPTFGYTLTGVITGAEPAAVFVDGKGNQLLVRTGGSLDGDSRVVSIRPGRVRVRFNDKNLDLTIGGNSSGN